MTTNKFTNPDLIQVPATDLPFSAAWGDTVRQDQRILHNPPNVQMQEWVQQTTVEPNTSQKLKWRRYDLSDTHGYHYITEDFVMIPEGLDGLYFVIISVDVGISVSGGAVPASAYHELYILKNSTHAIAHVNEETAPLVYGDYLAKATTMSMMAEVEAVAGDYFEVHAYNSSPRNIFVSGTGWSRLDMQLVRPA